MKLRVVLENHSASYADSIKVAKGEFLSLTGREDVGDGHRWLWAIADDGREGWYAAPDGKFTRTDFVYDKERYRYICPGGKMLKTSGTTHDGTTIKFK